MRPRLEQELALLRKYYPDIEHREQGGEDWFRIPRFAFPAGWQIGEKPAEKEPVVFKIVASYPAGEPYGFAAPTGINFKGIAPKDTGSAISPPFDGSWQHFSWAPDGWTPSADAAAGSNLLAWVRSFTQRLKEGA